MHTDKHFFFSVIMAVYNVYDYLEEAIQSIVNQTLPFNENIELVLVNDGSTDNSKEICLKYRNLYPDNVVFIDKKNGGASSARNAGLKAATGKYANFLDSDDYFDLNAFEAVKAFILDTKEVSDIVCLNIVNFEGAEGSWKNKHFFKETRLIDLRKEPEFVHLSVPASFIKLNAAKRYYFDERIKILEDAHLIYKIFRKNPLCGIIADKITYWHRVRLNSTSATQNINTKKNIEDMLNYIFCPLVKRYSSLFKKPPLFFQNFVLSEMNYYVVKKIHECNFSYEVRKKIENQLRRIMKKISDYAIENNSTYLLEKDREILLLIKEKTSRVFDPIILLDARYENKKMRQRIRVFIVKAVLYIPKRVYRLLMHKIHRRIDKIEGSINSIFAQQNDLITHQHEMLMRLNDVFVRLDDTDKGIIHDKDELKKLQDKNDNMQRSLYSLEQKQIKLDAEIAETRLLMNYGEDKPLGFVFYFHGGVGNRGCEALVKTAVKCISPIAEKNLLFTFRKEEDVYAGMNEYVKYILEPVIGDRNAKIEFMGTVMFNREDMGLNNALKLLNKESIAVSIGGDNYCYGDYVAGLLGRYNQIFHENKIKTVLFGCSIEPELLGNSAIVADLNSYDLILARESITYDALLAAGVNRNTLLLPDTAFILEPQKLPLPDNFIEGNTIGINLSPLVQNLSNTQDGVYNNCVCLIKHIINNTGYNVALIPHVYWEGSNDLAILSLLFNEFADTGRVCLIGKHTASELKGFISRCKMFVGARTHATIAAYSSFVPTLVVGYSVKSKGIAKDLFGTYSNYVISVQDLNSDDDLTNAFLWLENNCGTIKEHLEKTMPGYIGKINLIPKAIEDVKKMPFIMPLPYQACTGCTACQSVCPNGSITMKENGEGFKYPVIDYTKCMRCGKCSNACPVLAPPPLKSNKKYVPYALVAKAKDEKLRQESSSGGVFSVLAKYVLATQGIVYGAAYDQDMVVTHQRIDRVEELHRLRGSKYVQSGMEDIFPAVKSDLEKGVLVLFSGTPCQIKGLNQYLGEKYNNLIMVDVACHGVPSPKVFREYIQSLEAAYKSKVVNFEFRNKQDGWKKFTNKIIFEDRITIASYYGDNIYMRGFLKNLYLRESCYICPANNFTSGSDLTIADYWGVENIHEDFDDDKGVSLVLVNSNQGETFIDKIKSSLWTENTDMNLAIANNPPIIKPALINPKREEFFLNMKGKDIIGHIEELLG